MLLSGQLVLCLFVCVGGGAFADGVSCRWVGPTGGGFKTGGYINVGDEGKMRISIDLVDANDGGVVVA